ncbi:MAG: tetratricopeptide repeat protein [Terriglobales bacterium]
MNRHTRFATITIAVFGIAAGLGCNQAPISASASAAKIPITTKSEEARNELVQGRDLADRLLGHESVEHFQKAVALDPDFASAELAWANSAPTAKEFFEHLNKAVSLADKASEGERLLILANQAAANGDVTKQKEYCEKLVAAYPNDERAQFALGGYYFGQQDLVQAIEHNKKATELAPSFSPAYNTLGYAYRQAGDYANAEQAFKKNIDLIPNDPNPYDSYAELLLKMGKFEDSVVQYRKALSLDANFNPSRFGVSADLMYLGKPAEAESELQAMAAGARNDGELRTAYFALAVLASDSAKFDKAQQAMDKEYGVAEKKNDVAAMAADLQAKGNIALAAQQYAAARQHFDRSFQMIQDSSLSRQIKDNSSRVHHFNLAAIAIEKRDLAPARSEIEEFRKAAEATNNAIQLKQVHELVGRSALAQKDYEQAIAELEQANQQDPRNLYRLGLAYQAKGDRARAHEYFSQAAEFNSLPALPYAFIRLKAQKLATTTKA